MMALVTIDRLNKMYEGNVEFYFHSNGYSSLEEIQSEFSEPVNLKLHQPREMDWSKWKWVRSYQKRKYLFDASEIAPYDEIFVLGGDDLSEYYTDKIYRDLLKYWRWSKSRKLILWQQSMGPFTRWKNRLVVRYFYKKIPVYVRDFWSKKYLKEAFNLDRNVIQGADLAFADLPLQHNKNIEKEILEKYGLSPGNYVTLVISGLQGKYYTNNKTAYYNTYKQILEKIKSHPHLKDFKIVLLAHTFPPHGDESRQIHEFMQFIPEGLKENIVPVTDKILPTRARFVLGNGMFTLTGRMHAAISTFQTGKPAVSLSYSAKYKGVIGMNLNRNDLIIDADRPELWESGKLVHLVENKINYVIDRYAQLTREIKNKVEMQKKILDENFDSLRFETLEKV